MTNQGKIFATEYSDAAAPPWALIFRVRHRARIKVMGMIISVRVSLTMVASSPAVSLKAKPAATTEEVSLMAVPAQTPKPVSVIPKARPSAGKMNTARILNRKMVEME